MEAYARDKIAIIGMACRTAGANSPPELWDLLVSSRDVQREITRFNVSAYHNPDEKTKPGLTKVKSAYLMDDELVESFDSGFFHVTPNEAPWIDPQHRHLLEVSYEAVESAGIPLDAFKGSDTGVFTGVDGNDYGLVLGRDLDNSQRFVSTGMPRCMAANRLSFFYDLSGPSLVVDTACSSSMTALHQAVRALECGDCSMALVCGSNIFHTPDMFVVASEMGFISPSGRCCTFDKRADGYGRGEGVVVLLLKPLAKAVEDRDPIRAVLTGIRVNHDGRTQGIMMPSKEAQEKNMRALYQSKGIFPDSIQYVECHGTGTTVGDVKETSAINAIFNNSPVKRRGKLIVGSVKSNIGHLEAVAGLAGVLKTVLCLEHGRIPAQTNFETPNPAIGFEHIVIPTSTLDWPATTDGVRRAAVNCFGAGGTNGHVVLESFNNSSTKAEQQEDRPYLFMISASSQEALAATCKLYAEYVTAEKPRLGDLAYTMLSRRSQLSHTSFFTADSSTEFVNRILKLSSLPSSVANTNPENVCWIFTGQGAQWPGMGAQLFKHSKVFRDTILACEEHLSALSNAPAWELSEELCKDSSCSNIAQVNYAQPLSTALQLGLVDLWASLGFRPKTVVGHSSGELAAAYAAGHLSLRDAIVVSYLRGTSMLQLQEMETMDMPKGAMCAVGLSEEKALLLLQGFEGKVEVAAVNSPYSCTLSGDENAVKEIGVRCAKDGLFFRKLRVDIAYHSRHILPVASSYRDALEEACIRPLPASSDCVMFSSVSGKQLALGSCDAQYWTDNMTGTVRFLDAFRACLQHFPLLDACFEVGPHPALQGPVTQILRAEQKEASYFPSCVRGKCDFTSQLDTASQLLSAGIYLDTQAINDAREARVLKTLPTHVWNHHARIWMESRISRNVRFKRFARHPLLGSRYTEDNEMTPSWRCRWHIDQLPWVGSTVPAATFVLMALEAARQVQEREAPEALNIGLTNVAFEEELFLRDAQGMADFEIHLTSYKMKESSQYRFIISSTPYVDSQPCLRHCSGTFLWNESVPVLEREAHRCSQVKHDPFLLDNAEDLGLVTKSRLKDIHLGQGTASAQIEAADNEVDPWALIDIMNLAQATAIAHDPSLVSKLLSIGLVKRILNQEDRGSHHVAAMGHMLDNMSTAAFSVQNCFEARDVLFKIEQNDDYKLPLRSLFYKAERRIDIADLPEGSYLSLKEILLLATHKWPNSDIGFLHLDHNDEADAMAILKSSERPRFRSLQISSSADEEIDESIRRVRNFVAGSQMHLMLARSREDFSQRISFMHEQGVAFVKRSGAGDEQEWESFKFPPRGRQSSESNEVFVFRPADHNNCTWTTSSRFITLDHKSVQTFCESSRKPYHAIVVDDTDRPVTTTWPGDVLVPWLQNLLNFAESVTWISKRKSESSVAVNSSTVLLRTLQAEQPSLKVRHLVYDADLDIDMHSLIEETLTESDSAFTELQQDIEGGQRSILRWLPDDDLSAKFGLLPQRKQENGLVQDSIKLSPNGTIVVVGGLGGVGRFVCSWLVQNGAKHITVISRSGPHSSQATSLMKLINRLGAILSAWKCDACDKQALSKILDIVRQSHRITGVINMAMILSDAPLASMTAADWDRPLRLKVDSSQNLHELTKDDAPEIFILFSSVASVLGNRSQAGYNVGNAFLNSLAELRRAEGLPAVAIALGAVTDMGVIHQLGREDITDRLALGGLFPLQEHHLAKILVAAIAECLDPHSTRAVILTGLTMFDRVDGRLIANEAQSMLYWTEQPDFSHLQHHKRTWKDQAKDMNESLTEQVQSLSTPDARKVIERAFFQFLASLLGFDIMQFKAERSLLDYGIDSLTAVSCQFWFHKELMVRISVEEMYASKTINDLLMRLVSKLSSTT